MTQAALIRRAADQVAVSLPSSYPLFCPDQAQLPSPHLDTAVCSDLMPIFLPASRIPSSFFLGLFMSSHHFVLSPSPSSTFFANFK